MKLNHLNKMEINIKEEKEKTEKRINELGEKLQDLRSEENKIRTQIIELRGLLKFFKREDE